MVVSTNVIEAARSVGKAEGVAARLLLAIAIVETNAVAGSLVGGRDEPLIRFEGHYFDRRLGPAPRKVARLAGLASPRAGGVRNPSGQAARWALLKRAEAIDAEAAFAATSWGLCQVMGDHGARLGYGTSIGLAARARQSAEGQLELGARFLKDGHLDRMLEAGDVAGFSRRYNGPNFARNAYDSKIAAALLRASRLLDVPLPLPIEGQRGPEVADLQRALSGRGWPLSIDGIFGPRTKAALAAFQARYGPDADPRAA